MSTEANTEAPGIMLLESRFGELRKNWGWMLALGVLFLILGVIGLYMTTALTLASVLFFGALLLAGGVFQLIDAFKCRGWKSIVWYVFIAILYLIAGIAVMLNPAGASVVLTSVLASMLIIIGGLRIVMAFQLRGARSWGWLLIGGIAAMVLGLVILAQWPVSGLWVIGLFVAIEMILHGASLVFIGLAAREAGKGEISKPTGFAY